MGNAIRKLVRSFRRISTKQRLITFALLGTTAVGVQASFQSRRAQQLAIPKRARATGHGIPVRTARVSQSDVVEVIGATGMTAAARTIPVVAGRASEPGPQHYVVKAVHAAPSAFVAKGSPLVEFEEDLFRQVFKHRQAELAAAAAIRELPGRLEAREQVLDAEANFEQAKLNLELARLDVANCTLRATVDGFVADLDLAVGDRVEFGQTITYLHQLDPIHVVMDLPQEEIEKVRIGQSADVQLDCFPEETFVGTLVQVPPKVDPTTRTLPVVVELANSDYRIKAGVSGFVRLRITKNAVTVPSIAAIRRGKKAMVFRVEDNRAHVQEVEVGDVIEPGKVEILTGLSGGDEVVIYGTEHLNDNDPVNTDWKKWAGRRDE